MITSGKYCFKNICPSETVMEVERKRENLNNPACLSYSVGRYNIKFIKPEIPIQRNFGLFVFNTTKT